MKLVANTLLCALLAIVADAQTWRECSSWEFDCGVAQGYGCINPSNLCDGWDDCGNWKDEMNCGHQCESSGEFTCANGACIAWSLVCSGVDDCGDSSDETYCGAYCKYYPIRCDDGSRCIKQKWECDGFNDCSDGSDEANCGGDGSCFSGGTKVILASGQEIAIEKQTVGLKMISNGGDATTITSEYVKNAIGAGGLLFGINYDKLFATVNHPFWTTAGWKCLRIEEAFEENPDIMYGILQIGDTVFGIAQTDPLMYEPIKISQFTFTTLSEPSMTYGLHLNGPQSYHANGYAVAANYPILTKKRVRDGKKKLGEGEKESLKLAIDSDEEEMMKVLGKWAHAFLDEGTG